MGRISGVALDPRRAARRSPAVTCRAPSTAAMRLGPRAQRAFFLYGLGVALTGCAVLGRAPRMRTLAIGWSHHPGGRARRLPDRRLAQLRRADSSSRLLLYAAFFFPTRWAWPLSLELILVAGAPLLYDARRDRQRLPAALPGPRRRLPRRHLGDGRAASERLVAAEHRQRDIANRDPLTGVGNRRVFDATMQPRARRAAPSPSGPPRRRRQPARPADPRPRRLQGRSTTATATRSATRSCARPPTRADVDPALDRHPGPHRRRRVRRDRPRRPRRRGAADGAKRSAPRSAPRDSDAGGPTPSASVGWAVFPDDGATSRRLMRAADERMLKSKRSATRRAVPAGLAPDRPTKIERCRRRRSRSTGAPGWSASSARWS